MDVCKILSIHSKIWKFFVFQYSCLRTYVFQELAGQDIILKYIPAVYIPHMCFRMIACVLFSFVLCRFVHNASSYKASHRPKDIYIFILARWDGIDNWNHKKRRWLLYINQHINASISIVTAKLSFLFFNSSFTTHKIVIIMQKKNNVNVLKSEA